MIEFDGIDIVVKRTRDDEQVRRALARAIGVPDGRVAVVADVSDYPARATADVVCVSSAVKGEFAALLSIQTEQIALPYDTQTQLAQRICELLDTEGLVPDDEADPYVMWLVSPGIAARRIALAVDAFDDGRYVIAPG